MIKSLERYFIQFAHLDFPKIGSIKWQKKEAVWLDGKLSAPVEEIIFDAQPSKPSKVFYNFLADDLNTSTEQAMIQYDQFMLNILENGEPLEIGNLGILKKINNEYNWETKFNSTNYFNDINLGTISLSESDIDKSHNVKKDKWLLWALLLTIIASIAIILKNL